ncbi:MAG: hypothetical protein UX45_C0033G0002 [Candidatus Uhrbacteria bacterium GW2011_GWF2_46_218]|uniref:Uncharacterized protein n=1 Tax=Candidatus Uhrbacteria bacterium GW2011_GWF2_46_218 TaxID=1619001 RepID=A0A0G1RLJ8_9BACT|nr:MAG: hypothetical protein UX45_C0033G0002 [Candidatus Uhrbacteria bacterium GW2011_GWF2_46_218]
MSTNVKIDRGVAFDGDAIVQGGIGNYALLINKDDLDAGAITEDAVSKEIETITLDTGTYAYKFESSKGSAQIIPSSPFRGVSAIDGFDHSLDMRIVDATQLSVNTAKKLRFQKVVVLVPLVNGKSMMYGRRVGLRMSDFQMMPGDADTGGSFQIVIKTPENDPPEIDPPQLIESTFDILTLLAP